VDVSDARRLETVAELSGIEGLHVGGIELGEFHLAERRDDVLADLQFVVMIGARGEVSFGEVL